MSFSNFRKYSMTVPWNLLLLTVGAVLFSFGVKSIAYPHNFVSGGLFGTAMLISYVDERLSVGVLYALLNVPMLLLGWVCLSRRFMLYTIYSIVVASLASQFITYDMGITDKTLAAIATGIVCGAGAGISLRSLGCDGGITILGIILHNKYNFSVGSLSIVFNALLFIFALPVIKIDNVLYSMVTTYLTATLMNYFMSMFDQRKLVFIISGKYDAITNSILKHLHRGCTLLDGEGAFTKQSRKVILTVIYNIQLKRLEEIIYQEDPNAFIIVESTHRVLGKGFSQRKRY